MINNKVAIYTRVSTSDKQSTELQARELTEYCEFRGWDVYSVYEDKMSGRTGERPAFRDLLTDAHSGRFNTVICWKLDRLFRSLKGLTTTLAEFAELNVTFVSLKDNIDLTTSQGRLMMHLIGAFAEFEADLIRERVIAGVRHAQSKGVRLGRPPAIDSNRILELRKTGLSMREVAKQLGISKGTVSKSLSKMMVSKTVQKSVIIKSTDITDIGSTI